jgi:hypothetical protein
MDRKKKIAFSYFNLKKDKYDKLIKNQLSLEDNKIVFPSRLIWDFEFLFGIKETLNYLLEWIVNERNINIPENSLIICRNSDYLRAQGLTWAEMIIGEKIKRCGEWVYTDGKLFEINDNEVSQ